ncbi:MAG: hypothetical protein JKY96_04800 [Phycisphaerales bacterium]|nr:hypothetical protein [Phycisphaerales bacterium]
MAIASYDELKTQVLKYMLREGDPVLTAVIETVVAMAEGRIDDALLGEVAFDPLSDAAPTNDILAKAPSVYLHACVLEACIYVENHEKGTTHLSLMDTAVKSYNRKRRLTTIAAQKFKLPGAVV